MRELNQNELNTVSGGEWNCGVTIELPPSVSVGCTGSGPDWREAWNSARDWWCESIGWWCDRHSGSGAQPQQN